MFQTIIGKASFQEYEFYDTSLDNHISYAFQALALDETRATFVPTVWERRPGCTTVRGFRHHSGLLGNADHCPEIEAMLVCRGSWQHWRRVQCGYGMSLAFYSVVKSDPR